ncbi:MAG: type II toxin-antitoxin system VapB family antitoxin [Thiomargarita sp.]|nr:type II toxin-antitoxin system VapB family antitoxin [Thiomargarita sp.]
MQVNINVNDTLFEQARALSGLKDNNELLQLVLQVFVTHTKNSLNSEVKSSDIPSVYDLSLDDDMSEASELESPNMPSLHKGRPLSLENMQQAIDYEAGKRKW